jgi:hypothetical protein
MPNSLIMYWTHLTMILNVINHIFKCIFEHKVMVNGSHIFEHLKIVANDIHMVNFVQMMVNNI